MHVINNIESYIHYTDCSKEEISEYLDMATNIAFCEKCRKKTAYTVSEKIIAKDFHGCKCEYLCKNAVCSVCGESVWVPEFHDFNLNSLYEEYGRQKQII